MMEFFKNLFSQEFMPHGHCLFWKTELLRLYIIGDGLTAIAYYSLPIAIAYFVYKRKDIAFKSIFVLFGVFILLCGTTHLMFIWTLWNPMYRLEIVIKLLTAVVSVGTAIIVWPIISKALTLPSPAQLRKVNEELTQEINNHKRTEEQLRELSLGLEKKVEELVDKRTYDLGTINKELRNEIAERKVADQALKESEEKFRTISTAANDAIIMSDNNSVISYWNKAAERTFGYSAEDAIGNKLQNTIIPEKYREAHLKGFDKFKDSGKGAIIGKTFEITAQRKDGTVFPIDISITGVKLKGNWCAIGIIRDITERKKSEDGLQKAQQDLEKKVTERTKEVEEKADTLEKSEKALIYLLEDVNEIRNDLEKANIKLKELDQLKSMFIASMSHELRTPLNSIIGFTGIILQGIDGEINPQQNDHLGRVNRSAKHLLALINDIIDLSKVEAGKVDVFVEDVVLNEVINEAVDSVRLQANEKGLALDVNVPQDVRMNTDRRRLYQCILNYLSNAVKFTESGTVSITAHETNGEVEIIVSDTGIGISTEDQQKLFKPFVRIDSHLRAKVLGTGLGLYLTRKLTTELLGGTVDVQSQPGKGSTFTLRLPKEIKKD